MAAEQGPVEHRVGAQAYKSRSESPIDTVSRLVPQRKQRRDTDPVQTVTLLLRNTTINGYPSRQRDTALIEDTPLSLDRHGSL